MFRYPRERPLGGVMILVTVIVSADSVLKRPTALFSPRRAGVMGFAKYAASAAGVTTLLVIVASPTVSAVASALPEMTLAVTLLKYASDATVFR